MNIYVGNLSYDTNETDLETSFAPFGAIESARVITDRDTGRSKGFGFVDMPNNAEAEAAIQGLNGKELHGRALTVNESKPKESDRGGPRRQGGSRW